MRFQILCQVLTKIWVSLLPIPSKFWSKRTVLPSKLIKTLRMVSLTITILLSKTVPTTHKLVEASLSQELKAVLVMIWPLDPALVQEQCSSKTMMNKIKNPRNTNLLKMICLSVALRITVDQKLFLHHKMSYPLQSLQEILKVWFKVLSKINSPALLSPLSRKECQSKRSRGTQCLFSLSKNSNRKWKWTTLVSCLQSQGDDRLIETIFKQLCLLLINFYQP